jgi:phosphomannomutase
VKSFADLKIDRRDGLRFDFSRGWFQIRKSNIESISRLIIETDSTKLSLEIKKAILSFFR